MFLSSGDILADRRYETARGYAEAGDHAAAADLFAQATELAPGFASAWFALGESRVRLGERGAAVAAFRRALAADPADRHGAALHLARLGAGGGAMSPAYVRALFDQYAPRFDAALAALSYSAPALLHQAVIAEQKRFGAMLDLGCGTGLAGAAFRPHVDWLVGVDLSAKMVEAARAKGLYDKLAIADIGEFLSEQGAAAFHLVVAADVFVYLADLAPVCAAIARVLAPGGLLAFTVETHAGEDVILGETLRYAHGAAHVRAAVAGAGFGSCQMTQASTRTENGVPVSGLLIVARR